MLETSDPENAENENKKTNQDSIDELTVVYFFKCCSIFVIIFTIVYIILIWFPVLFFCFYCAAPYKRVVIIDEDKQILIVCNKGMIPCCKLNPKSYALKNIQKVRIYVTWQPDPNIGFNKLYCINCEIYSIDGQNEELFSTIKYDKETFDRYISYFKKHFNTEFEPIEMAKRADEYSGLNNGNIVDNNYPEEKDIIETKPIVDESAALPILP